MKKIAFVWAIFILSLSLSYAQNNRDTLFTQIGHSVQIESGILNQTKKVFIHLPFKFDKSKEYPLVVLADVMAFKPLSSITEIMAYNRTIPFCIVVCAVPTNAQNDYSPIIDDTSDAINGGKTMAFYEKELFPYLTSKYNISKKIIWGQNYSGMFTTFILLSRPGLFDGYLSDVPRLDLLKKEIERKNCFVNLGNDTVFYQVSWTTSKDKPAGMNNLLKELESDAPDNLKWTYTAESDSIMITHILTNYTYGLKAFFREME